MGFGSMIFCCIDFLYFFCQSLVAISRVWTFCDFIDLDFNKCVLQFFVEKTFSVHPLQSFSVFSSVGACLRFCEFGILIFAGFVSIGASGDFCSENFSVFRFSVVLLQSAFACDVWSLDLSVFVVIGVV